MRQRGELHWNSIARDERENWVLLFCKQHDYCCNQSGANSTGDATPNPKECAVVKISRPLSND